MMLPGRGSSDLGTVGPREGCVHEAQSAYDQGVMRPLATAILLLVLDASCAHRQLKPERQDECINPYMESMA
jgi:hypothetical protein